MAKPVIQYDAGKLTAISATISNNNQVLTYVHANTAASFQPVPYDIAGSFPDTPTTQQVIFSFIAVRGCTIPNTATTNFHKAKCVTAPSGGNVVFDVKVNGITPAAGTLTFLNLSTTGTFSFASDVVLAAGDVVTIEAPATSLYTMTSPTYTLFAVVA